MIEKKKNTFGFIAPFITGFIIGIVVVTGSYTYYRMSKPVEAQSTVLQWAQNHSKETEWAMNRYEKFQEAARSAYFEEDIQSIKPSK